MSNKNVKWTITKGKKCAKLVSVKKKSVSVKGIKGGTVYVTAKAGKQTKKIKVTVRSYIPKEIKLETTKNILGIGDYCTVSVKSVSPSYASKDVDFSSSDPSVANVSSVGYVAALKPGTATITATSKKSKSKKASITIYVVDARAGTLTATIDMTDAEKYPAGKSVKAWFEIPVSDENQSIKKVEHKAEFATREEIVSDSSGAQAYYIEWGPDVAPENRTATLSFHIYRRAVLNNENLRSMEKGKIDTKNPELMAWCHETAYRVSLKEGIVKETADKIV